MSNPWGHVNKDNDDDDDDPKVAIYFLSLKTKEIFIIAVTSDPATALQYYNFCLCISQG